MWTDATNWSSNPNYPNNGGGTTYDVTMTNTTQALLDGASATVGQLNMASGTSIQIYNSSSAADVLTIDPSSVVSLTLLYTCWHCHTTAASIGSKTNRE